MAELGLLIGCLFNSAGTARAESQVFGLGPGSTAANSSAHRRAAVTWFPDVETGDSFLKHQEKLLQELNQYRIISPFIVSGGQMWNMDLLQQSNYTDELQIWVEIEEQQLTLNLKRNRMLVSEGFQVSYYDVNRTLVTEQNSALLA
ncbi:uncharacterized protein LOC144481240 [Mustelus asterias]